MKIKIEFDLTPEEFRQSLGLPDVSGLQEKALSALQSRMGSDLKDIDVPDLLQNWLSQGLATSRQLQQAFSSAVGGVMDGATAKKPSRDTGDDDA